MGNNSSYRLSYTSGGLLLAESRALAGLYLQYRDWSIVREQSLLLNSMHARTRSSNVRVTRELISRLSVLNEEMLNEVVNSSDERKVIDLLWFSICSVYSFVAEFCIEVIRDKILAMDCQLASGDYDKFFNSKAQWSKDLDLLALSTSAKLKQVLFRMLRETGYVSENNEIILKQVDAELLKKIHSIDSQLVNIFPTFPGEVERSLK